MQESDSCWDTFVQYALFSPLFRVSVSSSSLPPCRTVCARSHSGSEPSYFKARHTHRLFTSDRILHLHLFPFHHPLRRLLRSILVFLLFLVLTSEAFRFLLRCARRVDQAPKSYLRHRIFGRVAFKGFVGGVHAGRATRFLLEKDHEGEMETIGGGICCRRGTPTSW